MRVLAVVVATTVSAASCGGALPYTGPSATRSGGGCADDPETCASAYEAGALGSTSAQLVGIATIGVVSALIGYTLRSRRR